MVNIDVTYHDIYATGDFDRAFPREVAATLEGKALYQCLGCGKCSAGCPVADALEDFPHQIIRKTILGLKDEVLASPTLWICATCFRCNDRCPEDVNPASIMFVLKNMATEAGVVPDGKRALIKSLFSEGWASIILHFDREDLELPEIDEDPHAARVQALFKKTGLARLVGDPGEEKGGVGGSEAEEATRGEGEIGAEDEPGEEA